MNHLSEQEKRVAERFMRLIYNGSVNTAYQYMFTEAILRTVEAMPNQNELDLDTIFLYYAEISYDWCGRKRLLLGGTTEGIKGASKINSVVNEFIQLHHLNVIEPLSQDYLVDLKKKIKPLSRWVQENVGSESKGICQITAERLLITDETRQFICKYIQDLRESNEKMAKQFLDKIEGNKKALIGKLQLFNECNINKLEKESFSKTRRRKNLDEEDIQKIQQKIKAKGLSYSYSTLSNFYLSLKSKPFTILAGISGTGKSKLVRLFSEAIDANFTLISVKPDWSDATDLLGYRDLNQNYHMGKLIEIINSAKDNLDKPYIICLDEMNLARVEYYLSDFLSIIESRQWKDEYHSQIVTDHFKGEDVEQYSIPENVYIVGTVNMDETTFQFSKKVLDRANTIELSEVDLNYDFKIVDDEDIENLSVHNKALRSNYLVLQECWENTGVAIPVIQELITINEYLKPCGLQFAYRVRDEIVFYMIYSSEYGIMETEEAFDYQILQKILPRIGGTSERIRKLILNLLGYCIGNPEKILGLDTAEAIEAETDLIEEAIYPRSASKLMDMLRRFEEDGFTSFWF